MLPQGIFWKLPGHLDVLIPHCKVAFQVTFAGRHRKNVCLQAHEGPGLILGDKAQKRK